VTAVNKAGVSLRSLRITSPVPRIHWRQWQHVDVVKPGIQTAPTAEADYWAEQCTVKSSSDSQFQYYQRLV